MSQNTSSFRFIIIRQFCLSFRFMAYMHMHIGPFIWTVLFFSRGNQMTIKEECKLHSSIEEMSLNIKQVFLPINSAEMKNICAEELNRRLSTLSIQEVNQKLQVKHDSEFQKCIHVYFEMIEFSTSNSAEFGDFFSQKYFLSLQCHNSQIRVNRITLQR